MSRLRERPFNPDQGELRAAADRLAAALSDLEEEEIVAEFKRMRRARKASSR
jgi:hypothetical protein